MICDEITSGLDAEIREQILDLLLALKQQQGMSMIFISHDLTVIRSLADRLIIMDMGKIVESGAVDDVFSHPKHTVTMALLRASIPDVIR